MLQSRYDPVVFGRHSHKVIFWTHGWWLSVSRRRRIWRLHLEPLRRVRRSPWNSIFLLNLILILNMDTVSCLRESLYHSLTSTDLTHDRQVITSLFACHPACRDSSYEQPAFSSTWIILSGDCYCRDHYCFVKGVWPNAGSRKVIDQGLNPFTHNRTMGLIKGPPFIHYHAFSS